MLGSTTEPCSLLKCGKQGNIQTHEMPPTAFPQRRSTGCCDERPGCRASYRAGETTAWQSFHCPPRKQVNVLLTNTHGSSCLQESQSTEATLSAPWCHAALSVTARDRNSRPKDTTPSGKAGITFHTSGHTAGTVQNWEGVGAGVLARWDGALFSGRKPPVKLGQWLGNSFWFPWGKKVPGWPGTLCSPG